MMTSPVPSRKNARKACSSQNIKVFVRCRPMNTQEKVGRSLSIVECEGGRDIVIRERPHDKFTKTFSFDKVFGPDSKQLDVYRCVAKPLVDEVLNGFNCTIFAYGQTGTGKTFTMEGERTENCSSWKDDPLSGIIPRCVNHLFDELRVQKLEFTMRVSFLELYNEELFDLLSAQDDLSKLRLYEDASRKGSCIIHGLEEMLVRSKDDVYAVIEKGSAKRQTAATLMNAHSSRSHTVFTVTVHIKENTLDGDELLKTGKLHLVDLAGSENIGRSGAVDKRAREAGNINQSLLTLGRVITSLVEKAPHVPYRESKLTRLLQDALGGRTKTSIIATVSPASINLEETLSTLDYAHRAKNITNKPEVNQKLNKKELIGEYTEEIERLRIDLLAMREKNGVYIANENYKEMMDTMEQQAKEITEKIAHIRTVEDDLDKKTELFYETQSKLDAASEQLESTTASLKNTRVALRNTQTLLHDTAIDRDEQKYLVSAHAKTEDLLLDTGRDLIDVAHTTTSHIDLLHQKIHRTRTVEEHNSTESETFEHQFGENINNMQQTLKELRSQHSEALRTLTADHSTFTSSLESTMTSSISELSTVSETVSSLLQALETIMEQTSTDGLTSCDQLNSAASELCASETTRLQTWQTNTLRPLLKSAKSLMNKNTSLLDTLKNSVSSKAGELQLASTERHAAHCSHSQELLTLMQEQLDHFKEHSASSLETVNELNEATQYHCKVTGTHLAEIIEQLQQIKDADRDYCADQTKIAEEYKVEHREALDEAQQNTVKTQECVKSERCASKKYTESVADQQRALVQQVEDLHSQGINSVAAVSSECSEVCSSVEATMAVSTQQLAELSQRHANTAKDLCEELKSHKRKGASSIEEGQAKILKMLNDECSTIEEQVTSVERNSEQLGGRLALISAQQSDSLQEQHLLLSERQAEVRKLLREKMEQTAPTGTTPVRQDYPFKRSLTATSPHERLLQRYRSANSARLAARVPLPHDSDLTEGSSFNSLDNSDMVYSSELGDSPAGVGSDSSLGDVRSSAGDSGVFLMPPAVATRHHSSDASSCLIPGPVFSAPVSRSSSSSSITDSKENRSSRSSSQKRAAASKLPPATRTTSADARAHRVLAPSN